MSDHTNHNSTARRSWMALPAFMGLVLITVLTGCASTRPLPTLDETRSMQSRNVGAGVDRTVDAMITVLQDLSYSVKTSDSDAGYLVAERDSRIELAEISRDQAPKMGKPMPTWQKAALIGTGAIAVVALVAVLSDRDDDHEKHHNDAEHRRDHGHDHHGDGDVHVEPIFIPDMHTSGPTIYHYQLTLSLKALDANETCVRISGQGSKCKEGTTQDAGPILDRAFYDDLYNRLNGALERDRADTDRAVVF
jgi:hypothetical protein